MTATFSTDKKYRYVLERNLRDRGGQWTNGTPRVCLFIMLNPSTADEVEDDPTIRRCMGFATSWGYDTLRVVNLFGYRATNPAALKKAEDPVGRPVNNHFIRSAIRGANCVVAAWGTKASDIDPEQAEMVQRLMNEEGRPLLALGYNKDGSPKHPLYIAADTKPVEWPVVLSNRSRAGGSVERRYEIEVRIDDVNSTGEPV